jgi:predicted nucleotidyltransferase
MRRKELLERVKQTVLSIEPSAEVILYGSRARGHARRDSDWDFLVLVDGPVDREMIRAIRHALYDVEWQTGHVLSCIVHSRREWHSRPLTITPFHENVAREGTPL